VVNRIVRAGARVVTATSSHDHENGVATLGTT
jgi:hypothetical protein